MKTVVGVVLVCALALSLSACFFSGMVITDTYDNAEAYHTGNFATVRRM